YSFFFFRTQNCSNNSSTPSQRKFLSLAKLVQSKCGFRFILYDYSDYYDYLPPEQLKQLIQASGYVPNLIVDETIDGPAVSGPVSSNDIASLPVHLQDLLRTVHTIPHASDRLSEPPKVEIERPEVPNRYKMEEDHKFHRRKLRTLILV
ncbi:hypothetical protein AHF37_11552, partial [Paragonimus kellicotti]